MKIVNWELVVYETGRFKGKENRREKENELLFGAVCVVCRVTGMVRRD